jgi:uncharacterized membrane protein
MAQQSQPHPEHRWPVLVTTVAAFALYIALPDPLPWFPSWVIPIVGLVVMIPLVLYNPHRLTRESKWSRWVGIGFAFGLAAINQIYIISIVGDLIGGATDGPAVLGTAFGVWITNVITFALVYWELDRGGPVARRAEGVHENAPQDFRFPQQDGSPGTDPNWQPGFFDYAFFSITTMMAFSPTDVMPLTLRAKGLMAYQALTGFVLLALVISRAINILA